jgi:hypothetical protein
MVWYDAGAVQAQIDCLRSGVRCEFGACLEVLAADITGNKLKDFEAIRFRKGLLHKSKVGRLKAEGPSSSVYFST